MRRVSVAHAKEGMVLGRAVFDTRGRLVLGEGDKLSADDLSLLARSGSAEILIEDSRVADIVVGSLFSAQLEAKAVQALHTLLVSQEGTTEGVTPGDIMAIQPWLNKMVERLFPEVLGEPELSGSASIKGYDYIHPVKVAALSMLLGRYAGLDQADLTRLSMAALLENIGYLSLPPEIMEKDGPLTEDEWQHIRRHPQEGASMIAESGLEADVITAIGQHHERWDGSGYPEGRKGEEISLFARIIALADTFHALLSKRPHRPAFKPHEAVEFIVAYSGAAFDPELAQIFARRVPQYPAGLAVKLNTGEVGIISDPNIGHIARPIIRICVENGEAVDEPFDLDLSSRSCMDKIITQVLL